MEGVYSGYKKCAIPILLILSCFLLATNKIKDTPPYIQALLVQLLFSIGMLMINIPNVRKFAERLAFHPSMVDISRPTVIQGLISFVLLINIWSTMHFTNSEGISYLHQIIYGISMGLIILGELLDSAGNKKVFLISTILVNLLFVWTQLRAIPSFYGDDPQYHMGYVSNILSYGDVRNNGLYSTYPIMHIFVAEEIIISRVNIKVSAAIGMAMIFILMALILFLIIENNYGSTTGIISATLFFTAGWVIYGEKLTLWPTNFSSALMIFSLYIFTVHIMKKEKSGFIIIYIISISALIFSHSLTGLVSSILLLTLGLMWRIFPPIYTSRYKILPISIVPFLITIFRMAYHGNLYFERLVKSFIGKAGIAASFTTPSGSLYARTIPPYTYILATLQDTFFFTFAVIGTFILLATLTKDRKNTSHILLLYFSVIAILMFGIYPVDLLFKLGLAPDRFRYYSSIFLPIPISIYLWASTRHSSLKKRLIKSSALALLIMVTIPLSDSFVYDPVPLIEDIYPLRYVTYSETYSLGFLSLFPENYTVGTDNDLSLKASGIRIILDFYQKEFNNCDYVIIRKFHLTGPIYSRGIYKLPYNVIQYLNVGNTPKYSLIYTTNRIWIFRRE